MFEEKAARRSFFLSRVKRGAAAGSDYRSLMQGARSLMPAQIVQLLTGLRYAIVGGVATRMYQPERFTKDIDVLLAPPELDTARARLIAAAGTRTGGLALPNSHLALEGEIWTVPAVGEIDLLWSDRPWVGDAIASAVLDDQGLAIVGLPHLIAMKLDASRGVDQGDLSRMLGFAGDPALEAVRAVIAELFPALTDDLENYIEIGRLEIGEHRDG